MLPSAVDEIRLRGRPFYIKRDDQIDACLSGNKYRKLFTLLQTPSSHYTHLISYGGAQSNAMYALSCLCQQKGWEFHYYVKSLPKQVHTDGNLGNALANGMHLHELSHHEYGGFIEGFENLAASKTLLISQGGAERMAAEGIKILADEINQFKAHKGLESLNVVLPSGTGTTALYLKHFVDTNIEVYTSVCVGDEAYQIKQWNKLSHGPFPVILPGEKSAFAAPNREYLAMYQELMAETGIVFDLIYAPKTWIELLAYFKAGEPILYVHTGGTSGNESMLSRYSYLGMI